MQFLLSKRLESFAHAFRGAKVLVATQHNAWIHLLATGVAVVAGAAIGLSSGEWIAVLIVIGMVWTAEALNTSLELLADEISLQKRERIRKAKDVAAFGVLASSVTALVVGLVVFGRHLLT